ncbi:MAG: hypothetical protein FJ027_02750 [Candidatus Rokubacteria bacterium]|nr:hypothetical protein [Candidatus Rokubacteria bacterium]
MNRRRGLAAVILIVTTIVALPAAVAIAPVNAQLVAPGRPAPELAAGAWINSEPLTMRTLRGRVVLVDVWTNGVRAWPTAVLIDRTGVVRFRHIGEGAYEETEAVIRRLLGEAG